MSFRSNPFHKACSLTAYRGWSGGAIVLGELPVPRRPTIWITVGQGPTALAVGAGGGCLNIFTLIYPFFPLSPSLWETARLKYCLKGPLNPKPTNQPTNQLTAYNIVCTIKTFTMHCSSPSNNCQKEQLIILYSVDNVNRE